METFEITFNPNEKEGVFGVSLVESPAIEIDFVALSKEPIQLATIDEDKRILIGAILVPDKIIPRDGYNIVFSKETVALAQEYFFKRNNNHNSTIEHDPKQVVEGFTIFESWIKEDNEKDKSVLYGIDAPIGSWLGMAKVDNDEVWAKVKSGEVKGFSIDGFFDTKPIKNNYMLAEIKQLIEDGFAQLSAKKEPEVIDEAKEVEPIKLAEEEVIDEEKVTEEKPEVEEMLKQLALEFAKQIDNLRTELKAEIEKMKLSYKDEEKEDEPTKLTKAKPEVQVEEPKDFKSRILNKLKNQ